MSRVKFYSVSDMANGYHLEKMAAVISEYSQLRTDYALNDIIELYNIVKLINADIHLTDWSNDYIINLKSRIPTLNKTIAVYIKNIDGDALLSEYSQVEYDYIEDLWELIDKFKTYRIIPANTIITILGENQHRIRAFLLRRGLVDYYDIAVRDVLLSEERNAEMLLDKYVVKHDRDTPEIYFPPSLTDIDKEALINRYILWHDANLNYLRIIINTLPQSGLILSDKTRFEAKKRADIENAKLFANNQGYKYGASVCFSNAFAEEAKVELNGGIVGCTYNLDWIKDNLNFATVLNNFIYLFGYTDYHMRVQLVSKEINLGLFERFLSTKAKNSYVTGVSFNQISALSNLQIIGYYGVLLENKIRLESVIEWFFKTYLHEEFGILDYRITMPSDAATFLEKCRALLPELDAVLKQYNYYVDDGVIDHDLMRMSSNHLFFKDVNSIVPDKYVYPKENGEYMEVTYYLFSDQSMLAYSRKTADRYHTFKELLENETVNMEDCERYQLASINRLISLGYLVADSAGGLHYADKKVVRILYDLYQNEVISYWHYSQESCSKIDALVERGVLEKESSLLSRPEQAYFNYHLNRSDFCNSLDLRNMYSHGTQPNDDESEKVHEANYFVFLKLMILIVIKINDDLCIHADIIDNVTGDKSV